MELPRTVELDEMETRSKEWELAGFVVFKDERNTIGVLLDSDGGHWDRFYVRRREYWLDMRDTKLAFLAREIHTYCAAQGLAARLMGHEMRRKWDRLIGASFSEHSYERIGKLADELGSSTTKDEILRDLGTVWQQAVNFAGRKYAASLK